MRPVGVLHNSVAWKNPHNFTRQIIKIPAALLHLEQIPPIWEEDRVNPRVANYNWTTVSTGINTSHNPVKT
jgi:hypothetical protein